MKQLLFIILIALVVLNILDGDFTNPSWLDYVKWVLFILCFALLGKDIYDEKRR